MKYENTILKTIDVDTIPERLDELMEEDKIYMDSNIFEIALAGGFNSKSTFNSVFAKAFFS